MIYLESLSQSSQGVLVFCVFTALGAWLCLNQSKWLKKFWIEAGEPPQAQSPEFKEWRIFRNHGYALILSTIILLTIALLMPGK